MKRICFFLMLVFAAAIYTPAQQINYREYFFDTDPGIGNGHGATITAGDSITDNITFSTIGLGVGFHRIYDRYRYNSGQWGETEDRLFYIYDTTRPQLTVSPLLVKGEYFFDTDPGVGNGLALPAFTTTDSLSQSFNFSTDTLHPGFHRIYIRYKNAGNNWGETEDRLFYIYDTTRPVLTTRPNIVAGEYFFDTDPGPGRGTLLASFAPTDSLTQNVSIPVGSLASGSHTLFIRYKDAGGNWGEAEPRIFSICGTPPHDTIVAQSSTTICSGGTVVIVADTVGNSRNTYQWQNSGTNISSATSYTYTASQSGLYTCIITDDSCIATSNTISVTVNSGSSSSTNLSICASALPYIWNGLTFTTAGSQTANLTNHAGCDSAATLVLTVNPITTSAMAESICQGGSYTFGGHTLTSAGTYHDTLTSALGCDSIVTLTLSVSNALTSSYSHSICQGSGYTFGGHTLTSAGTYYDTLTSALGCDSIVTLTLSVSNALTSSYSYSICQGSSYAFGGHTLTSAGTYHDTLTSVAGCDSIVTLALSVSNALTSSYSHSICQGSSYTFGGHTLTSAGTYYDSLTSVAGCDSIVTLTLSVSNALTSSYSHSICQGSSYTFGGHTLTSAGTYYDTLTSSGGCDSIVTLTLTVSNALNSSFAQSICTGSSYTFGGYTLTSAGTYYDTLTSSGGCDSIVTLTLIVSNVLTSSYSHSICNGSSYTFGGHTLTSAGTYYDTLTSSGGCDSIVTLTLIISNVLTSSYSHSICNGSSYTFGGHTLTSAGTYYDTLTSSGGCDSIVTLNLTVGPAILSNISDTISQGGSVTVGTHAYTQSGTYVDTLIGDAGCDSIVTLQLDVITGIENIRSGQDIHLYPNPNHGSFTLETSNAIGRDYTISDMLGNKVAQDVIKSDNQLIDMPDAAEGVYTLVVKGAQPLRFVIVR